MGEILTLSVYIIASARFKYLCIMHYHQSMCSIHYFLFFLSNVISMISYCCADLQDVLALFVYIIFCLFLFDSFMLFSHFRKLIPRPCPNWIGLSFVVRMKSLDTGNLNYQTPSISMMCF